MIRSLAAKIDWLAEATGWVGAALVIALTGLMGWEVFMRYVLNNPTQFSFDVSQMLQVYLATLAVNYVLKEERHITVELVLERLPPRWVNRLNVVTSLISVLYCGVMVYLSWLMAMASLRMGERTMVLEAPVFPLKLAIAVGFALFGLQFLSRAYKFATSEHVPVAKHVPEPHALPIPGVQP